MITVRDLIHISVRQVFRQRRRSLGVVLAIALGTAGLLAVMAMGDEVKKKLNHDLDLLGGATLIKMGFDEEKHPGTRDKFFTDETQEALRALQGVDVVSAATEKINWVPMFVNDKKYVVPVQGVDAGYWSANSLEPVSGFLFDKSFVGKRALVCVIGEELAESLFGEENALGNYIHIGKEMYKVLGVVGGLQIGQRKSYAFVPLTTAIDRSGKDYRSDRIYLRCKTWDDVKPVADALLATVKAHQSADYLVIEVSWEQLHRLVLIVWWVQLFIFVSIGATLTLGGFGIWNGMMSSVIARTREIGLKKAMGAEGRDIKSQFLCEAFCLSLSAAILGVVLGYWVVEFTSHFLGSTPSRDVFMNYAGMSIVFSGLLGLVTGYYPALRASRLDAVTAIRFE
ncbi:ABC transporter permease [Pseudodesulfovibrio methanolicus]|uniref:ABC transporter permease n=1 Tax=Pseudodesulfovibrio methanolicus TaxID=3126690 RepID=A0ABZ2ITQ1_9BACT